MISQRSVQEEFEIARLGMKTAISGRVAEPKNCKAITFNSVFVIDCLASGHYVTCIVASCSPTYVSVHH